MTRIACWPNLFPRPTDFLWPPSFHRKTFLKTQKYFFPAIRWQEHFCNIWATKFPLENIFVDTKMFFFSQQFVEENIFMSKQNIWAILEKHGHFIDKEKYLVNVFFPVHIYFSSRFHASFQWAYSLLNISELISFPFDSSRLQLSKVFSLENHTFHCRNFWQVSATCWLVELTKNTRPETHHHY